MAARSSKKERSLVDQANPKNELTRLVPDSSVFSRREWLILLSYVQAKDLAKLSDHFVLFYQDAVDPLTDMCSDDVLGSILHRRLPQSRYLSNELVYQALRAMYSAIRLNDDRLDRLEHVVEHGVRPTIVAMAKHIEKDALPPAASVDYQLFQQLSEIENVIGAMAQHYADQDQRLNYHVVLISRLKDLIRTIRTVDNRFFFRAVLMIYDALSCVYAEDLTEQQVGILQAALVELKEPGWDREKLRSLDKRLRATGLDTIPSDKFGAQQMKREHANIP